MTIHIVTVAILGVKALDFCIPKRFYYLSMPTNRVSGLVAASVIKRVTITPRVEQTLELLLEGGSEKEMAKQLGISRHTVHVYVKSLYRHFDVSSRAELMALVLKAILNSSTRDRLFDLIGAKEERPETRDNVEPMSQCSVA